MKGSLHLQQDGPMKQELEKKQASCSIKMSTILEKIVVAYRRQLSFTFTHRSK